jgi:adenosylcobinamide-phosphate synthase
MDLSFTLPLALAALTLEALVGYPAWLYRAIGHPVSWAGALIGWLDRRFNREDETPTARRVAGVVALAVLLAVTVFLAHAVQNLLGGGAIGLAVLVLLASSLPAQRSLHHHVMDVATGLERDGLAGGRAAVSLIVGRNPDSLDEAGVARAAVESLAENFSDGVVAPAFWLAVAGLPGGAAYKAVNTADSMIGHRTPRYEHFGWAAARFDDLVNLPASRLSALWLILAAFAVEGASPRAAWDAVRRDAGRHRSPNAGWPEAAMAGALGFRLAGPRVYGDKRVEDAFMGDGRADLGAADIRRALRLYQVACVIQWTVLALLSALVLRG